MLEKANDLDNIRQEMEKEYYKNLNLSKQKKMLRATQEDKEIKPEQLFNTYETEKSKNCQTTLDLDTKYTGKFKFFRTF